MTPGSGGRVSFATNSVLPVGLRLDVLGWLAPGENVVDRGNTVVLDPSQVTFLTYDPAATTVLHYPTGTEFSVGNVVVLSPDESRPKGLLGTVESVVPVAGGVEVTVRAGSIADVLPVFDVNVDTETGALGDTTERDRVLRAIPVAAAAAEHGALLVLLRLGQDLDRRAVRRDTRCVPPARRWTHTVERLGRNDHQSPRRCELHRGRLKSEASARGPAARTPFRCRRSTRACRHRSGAFRCGSRRRSRVPEPASLVAKARAPRSRLVGTQAPRLASGSGRTPERIVSASAGAGVKPSLEASVTGDIWVKGNHEIAAYSALGLGVGLGPFLHLDGPSNSYGSASPAVSVASSTRSRISRSGDSSRVAPRGSSRPTAGLVDIEPARRRGRWRPEHASTTASATSRRCDHGLEGRFGGWLGRVQ